VAQEFKDFDKLLKRYQNSFLAWEHSATIEALAPFIDRWPYPWAQPAQEDVQMAVYDAASAYNWQMFRVSMKGQDTHTKVARLIYRFQRVIATLSSYDPEFKYEVTRINNYIGCLKRGGFLNDHLEIVK
jgi:hypothetical protein